MANVGHVPVHFILFHGCTTHHGGSISNLFSHYCVLIFPMLAICLFTYPKNGRKATTVDVPHVIISCNYMAMTHKWKFCVNAKLKCNSQSKTLIMVLRLGGWTMYCDIKYQDLTYNHKIYQKHTHPQNSYSLQHITQVQGSLILARYILPYFCNLHHLAQLIQISRNKVQEWKLVKVLCSLVAHFYNLKKDLNVFKICHTICIQVQH